MKSLKNAVLAVLVSGLAQGQQPLTLAFRFSPVIAPGTQFGGHSLSTESEITGIALNDNGEVALVASRLPGPGTHGTAALTNKGIVAASSNRIGSKMLLDVSGLALAIDDQGHVFYEASFQEGSVTGIGVFRDRQFLFAINGSGASDDFTVSPDGRVLPKAGVIANAGRQPTAQRPAPFWSQIRPKQSVLDRINRVSPVVIPPNVMQLPQAQQQAVRVNSVIIGPPQPARIAACPVPPFPFPAEWVVGGEVKGPITSSGFDATGPRPRSYQSPFFGHFTAPFRTIQYAADCTAQVIVIGDPSARNNLEFWTPAGLLTYARDGYLQLPGFSGNVPVGALARRDSPMRVNRRGQIAFPVKVQGEGDAVILATPIR